MLTLQPVSNPPSGELLECWLEAQDNRPEPFPSELPESKRMVLVVGVCFGHEDFRAFVIEDEEQLNMALNPFSFKEAQRLFYLVRRNSLAALLPKE